MDRGMIAQFRAEIVRQASAMSAQLEAMAHAHGWSSIKTRAPIRLVMGGLVSLLILCGQERNAAARYCPACARPGGSILHSVSSERGRGRVEEYFCSVGCIRQCVCSLWARADSTASTVGWAVAGAGEVGEGATADVAGARAEEHAAARVAVRDGPARPSSRRRARPSRPARRPRRACRGWPG